MLEKEMKSRESVFLTVEEVKERSEMEVMGKAAGGGRGFYCVGGMTARVSRG